MVHPKQHKPHRYRKCRPDCALYQWPWRASRSAMHEEGQVTSDLWSARVWEYCQRCGVWAWRLLRTKSAMPLAQSQ